MFTGLVEAVGAVAEVATVPGSRRVRIRTALAPELRPGDSLSVDGVCLTVTEIAGDRQRLEKHLRHDDRAADIEHHPAILK